LVSLSHFLRHFSRGREAIQLAAFDTGDIEQWLSAYKTAYTRQTWINRLSTLFSFGIRRGWIDRNPCARIERVSIDRQPPKILTPAQVNEILAMTPFNIKPYFIFATFAGIRPEETERLDWSAVNLETRTVTVSFGKTRRRRIVPLEPRAVRLLLPLAKTAGPVTPSRMTLVRWKFKVRVAVLKLNRFPQDLLRHSAASYLLALRKDAGKVAMTLGNSSSILLSHYHEPVTEKDCAEFWK
jgi:integrase